MIEEQYNARKLKYDQIGKSFVLHPVFSELISLDDVIIIGTRGSGKTTMLKMLTQEALDNWDPKSEIEKSIKEQIKFIGIYIPMSKILYDDLTNLYENSKLADKEKYQILLNIYLINIYESIIEHTYYFHKKFGKSRADENRVILAFKKNLNITEVSVYSINTLLTYLSREKSNWRNKFSENEVAISKRISGSLIAEIEPILRIFNEHFDFDPHQKYALCFDELDLYASQFATKLIKSLRGVSQNILLKLSLAPVQAINIKDIVTNKPDKTHDFRDVYLWPIEAEEEYINFSEKLAQQTISQKVGYQVNLDTLLGKFDYKDVVLREDDKESASLLSKLNLGKKSTDKDITNNLFKEMSYLNPDFKSFLEDKGIKSDKVKVSSRKLNSTTIRKIKEVLFNRAYFCKFLPDSQTWDYRTVNRPIIYHGKKIMIKSVDGNPRYLKKLMELLSKEFLLNPDIEKLSIEKQCRALSQIQIIFWERLLAIPVGDGSKTLSVSKLLDIIGDYLSYEMNLNPKFSKTNYYSFIKIPFKEQMNKYQDVLRMAINYGALLLLDKSKLSNMNTVKDKEVRLNYLLHIKYRMPIRKYYPIPFDKLLKNSSVMNQKNIFE